MSVMKPRRPWLMPTSGTRWRTSSRAADSMVPSPPITIARSASVSPSARTWQPRLARNARRSRSETSISGLRSLPMSAIRRKSAGMRRVYNEFHARQARPDPAQDADRALHRRGPAGRLAHAVEVLGARSLARHDPQRDGRPRGARLHREPAYLRRPRADAARLPLLRRHAARDQAARVERAAPPRGRAAPGQSAARDPGGLAAAFAAHPVRRRGDDAP